MTRRWVPTGVPVPRLAVGDPDWLRVMSASKVAAVLGLSPYESRYSLYWRMAGVVEADSRPEMTRGQFLEPGVADWFAAQHRDLDVTRTGSWRHPDRPWQVATPDRLVSDVDGNVAVLEAKTSAEWEPWGPDGSDEVPVWYRCQVMWQLDTLGLSEAIIVVLLPYLAFRTYVIDYDPADAELLRVAAAGFLDDLAAGIPPDLDEHSATYQVVRQLHPDIDDETVEIPGALADDFRDAHTAYRAGCAAKDAANAAMIDAMGGAHYAAADGRKVAVRVPSPRKGHPPFVKLSSGVAATPCRTIRAAVARPELFVPTDALTATP
jgi:putative phage-type endonuclease